MASDELQNRSGNFSSFLKVIMTFKTRVSATNKIPIGVRQMDEVVPDRTYCRTRSEKISTTSPTRGETPGERDAERSRNSANIDTFSSENADDLNLKPSANPVTSTVLSSNAAGSQYDVASREHFSSSSILNLLKQDTDTYAFISPSLSRIRHKPAFLQWTMKNFVCLSFLFLMFTTGSSAVWWSPGSNHPIVDSDHVCQWAKQVGGEQEKMCSEEITIVDQIRRGIKRGIESCQKALHHDRWNCSQTPKLYFSQVMSRDIAETAFVQALTAAGITHEVTMACTRGKRLDCGCSVAARQKRRELLRLEAQKRNYIVSDAKIEEVVNTWEWGGCDDNIAFGYQKSMQFLNITSQRRRSKRVNLKRAISAHNFEAGRLAVMNHMGSRCRCHGISGTCTLRTCWSKLPLFNTVRWRLRNRYDTAVRVEGREDGSTFVPVRRRGRGGKRRSRRSASATNTVGDDSKRRNRNSSFRRSRRGSIDLEITPEDLLFVRPSPAFCRRSVRRGSLGTVDRVCNPSIRGIGSCAYLCCGRGHRQERKTVWKKCKCRLVNRFNIICDNCRVNETRYYCR